MDMGDAYAKLKRETAVEAVYSKMNTAFAELEVAASLEVGSVSVDNPTPAVAQLGRSEPDILDVQVRSAQPVRNR